MLFRMYNRWAERHGFKVTTLDYLDGDEAGLKSASIMVEGENAYGYLKSEAGVHRLVRVSPFDAAGRRHTSFSSLEVMPEMELDNTVEIPPEDIKMEVYRASVPAARRSTRPPPLCGSSTSPRASPCPARWSAASSRTGKWP